MEKPEQILELERVLGFELRETKDSKDILGWVKRKTYLLNDDQQVIGLNLYACGLKDISFLKDLRKLKLLNLSQNQIKDVSILSNFIDLSTLFIYANSISDISSISNLTKLENLSISENLITSIKSLRNLINLRTLRMGDNEIKDINSLEYLFELIELRFGVNKVKDISVLKNLSKLKHLRIQVNPIDSVQQIQEVIKLPNLEYLDLFGVIAEIPPQYLSYGYNDNCLDRLKDYFQSIEKEEDRQELNEAKLIFVGRGMVGKTELADAISENNYLFNPNRPSTEAIRIKTWQLTDFEKDGRKADFSVNIWDFAGQEINYGTHQFFLTKSSLYVLVWRSRVDDPSNRFGLEYWLNIIQLLSNGSPVLVVKNWIDEDGDRRINEQQWKEQFPNIIGFYYTSCKDGRGIKEVAADIRKHITLPHTSEVWNKNRFALRKEIEEIKENYISYSEYVKLCEKHQIDKTSAKFLADQLHKIGVILHFADDLRFEDTVILKPEWATQAAYKLIDEKLNPQGRFKINDLKTFLKDDIYEGKHQYLLNLMLRFYLIFNILRTDEYIVPDLLPENPPDNLPILPQEKPLRFEYHYDFMPKSLLSHFICLNASYIQGNYLWKNGVFLQQNGSRAKVETSELLNYIRIEISGEHSSEFLTILRGFIQTVHRDILEKEPDFKEVIPCPCAECKKQTDYKKRHFFAFNLLRKLKENRKKYAVCNVSAEDISIDKLLTGIEPIETEEERRHRELKDKLDSIKSDTIEIKIDVKTVLNTLRLKFQEIQDSNLGLEERLEEQHKAIFNFLKDKSLVESRKNIDNELNSRLNPLKTIRLDSMTLEYLASAEYVWQNAANNLDYSMAITEFGKSVESIVNLMLEDFKSATPTYVFLNIEKIDLIDKCKLLEENKAEGKLKNQLTTNSVSGTDFLNHFNSYCNNDLIDISTLRTNLISLLNPSHLLDKNGVLYVDQTILMLIREVRNSAAHPKGIRTKQEAEEYRKLVLDFFAFWCNHLK